MEMKVSMEGEAEEDKRRVHGWKNMIRNVTEGIVDILTNERGKKTESEAWDRT